ncbi:MAG: hypothetical protein KatS3mg079_302 [Caloramator sp.]|nr:MAG: hypothetical protein KatS3mg079_302 [Caloramator sp.]
MIVKIFKALGHPIRYKIVKSLLDGPECVCKLNENIEFSQSNLSQHLRILKDAGVVKGEKVGLNIHYSLASDEIKELFEAAKRLLKAKIKASKIS